jgi:hypothetical protein
VLLLFFFEKIVVPHQLICVHGSNLKVSSVALIIQNILVWMNCCCSISQSGKAVPILP